MFCDAYRPGWVGKEGGVCQRVKKYSKWAISGIPLRDVFDSFFWGGESGFQKVLKIGYKRDSV